METKVYNITGKEAGKITLPEAVFAATWNPDLVHQVVVSMQANARTSIAHTKNRGDVSGGGKKPWKQKGTGRARHGSTRSPIWIGGGVTHGPRNEKNYTKKINRKMRIGALVSVLSKKFAESEIIFVDTLNLKTPKTATAREILSALAGIKEQDILNSKKHNTALVVLAEKDEAVAKSFANFGNIEVTTALNMNVRDALTYARIIVVNPEDAAKVLEGRLTVSKNEDK